MFVFPDSDVYLESSVVLFCIFPENCNMIIRMFPKETGRPGFDCFHNSPLLFAQFSLPGTVLSSEGARGKQIDKCAHLCTQGGDLCDTCTLCVYKVCAGGTLHGLGFELRGRSVNIWKHDITASDAGSLLALCLR